MRYSKGTRVYTSTIDTCTIHCQRLVENHAYANEYFEDRVSGITGTVDAVDYVHEMYIVKQQNEKGCRTWGMYSEEELTEVLQLPFEQPAFDNSLIKWIEDEQ